MTNDHRADIDDLRDEIDQCTVCADFAEGFEKPPSLNRGDPDAPLMIIGQEPANAEVERGRPFAGQSGTRLDRWLVQCGAPEDSPRRHVFLTAVIKCAHGGTARTFRQMARHCRPFLRRQIDLVRPEIIITLGARAYRNLTPVSLSYSNARFRMLETSEHQLVSEFRIHFTFLSWPHPSGRNRLLNKPEVRAQVENSCAEVRERIGDRL